MTRTLPGYDVLEIRLTPGPDDTYNVQITSAAGARGQGQFAAPDPLDIETFRRKMDPRKVRTRGPDRYLEPAREFGAGLFKRLLSAPSVRDVYTLARAEAHAAGRGLRVLLSLGAAPELASIPWEFLYDRPQFLAQHADSPVVRFVDLENPPAPLHVQGPLRVLGMISRPKGDELATLNAEQEQEALQRCLRPLIDSGQVTLHWLPRATLQALRQEVRDGEDFHVFHYIGHGEYDEQSGHGSLILEHEDRRARRVDGQQLGAVLRGCRSLRLAVLNACEAAQTAPQDPMAGVATSLMQFGVPAVVAMQFAITDAGALIFSDEFYGALAANVTVDAAVTEARGALAVASGADEWGTPVLFMCVADGRLFDLPSTLPQPKDRPRLPAGERAGDQLTSEWLATRRAIVLPTAIVAAVATLAIAIIAFWPGDGPSHQVSTAWLDEPSARPVQYCSGKDLSAADLRRGLKVGIHGRGVNDYNAAFPGSTARFVSNAAGTNQQRDYYLRLIEHDSKECDVIFLDVIYMAEFVKKGLLYDMTPYLDLHDHKADFDDQMMKTVRYDGKLWGVPKQHDAGALFYRQDRVRRPPTSWQDVYRQARRQGAAGLGGLRLQRETNEGLTVVFLELAYAAGNGRPIISEDGKTANIADEPAVFDALVFLRNAVRDHIIPPTKPGLEGSLDVYERGRASFLRGWPFVAARIQDDAERKGGERAVRANTARNTRIASLPPWRAGGQSFGVLGGHDLVIPRSAPNPSGALHFIDYLTRDEQVRKDEQLAAQYPVLKSVAEDTGSLTNKRLMRAIRETNAIPRPPIPQYAAVSNIIALGVHCVLQDQPDDEGVRRKLDQIDTDVEDALRSGKVKDRPNEPCT